MSRVPAIIAEFVGTAFLLAGVVGSGIMAERLSPNDTGLQLFENALATAGILIALILAFREGLRSALQSGGDADRTRIR